MARLILIDHSLRDIGGHHYDYALQVLLAAYAVGLETVLVCNRHFHGDHRLPKGCHVLPLFRYNTYNQYTIFARGSKPPAHAAPATASHDASLWHQVRDVPRRARAWITARKHATGPTRRIRDFSVNCHRAFRTLGIRPDDVMFLPTMSELDFVGLVAFLERSPASAAVDWHVQFPNDLFEGRDPDLPAQAATHAEMRDLFAGAMVRVPTHRLHFYNTTDVLARHHNLLGVPRAHFDELPNPINPEIHARRLAWTDSGRPLRITCAGGVRTEKGQASFGDLVHALWQGCIAEGRAQLVVQTEARANSSRPVLDIQLPVPATGAPPVLRLPSDESRDPVVYVRHPLGIEDYAELIRRADIGLLLYDSYRYFSRRAGVLGELLTAGIPAVVPAGCWLSEQLAEENFQHAERLAAELRVLARHDGAATTWAGAGSTTERAGDRVLTIAARSPRAAVFDVPAQATELTLSFDWVEPLRESGTYLQIELIQRDAAQVVLSTTRTIVGHRAGNARVYTLERVDRTARQVEVRLTNAYRDETIVVQGCAVVFHDSRATHPAGCPLGRVGLIFASPAEAPRLLREMVDHYAHFRQTAGEFSVGWFARHDPQLTVQTLRDRTRPAGTPVAATTTLHT